MTTHYTATVEITTPSVTLTDFTAVVPPGLGVNVYGAATAADINTFDVGPTGDTNILLQTHAAGDHHVHDGVCHDSWTPPGPSFGVHGIYDKANGSLIENIEFYNHPHGQCYSPRYGNRSQNCVAHDTPEGIGLFNYQGTPIGAGGALRIRNWIFYNIDAGGFIFYSDGVWRDSSGTILGDSLISVELDHCTIDARGITQPFPFQDCHNDVYLTNSIIISDAGLPLSSLVTHPTDGSTVHLDGSIVLTSAQAAMYLGAAPTFTPIVVGGSPVIGTAVASPPGVYAEWGNQGDLGATQTGSPPPGPPPLPGPATPALDYAVVGVANGAGSSLVIPITADVPRSSPSGGGTILLIYYQFEFSDTASVASVTDDAPVDDAYSLCIFEDGLNHYVPLGQIFGLVVNPLVGGVNNITLTLSGAATQIAAVVVAITGVAGTWPLPTPFDPGLAWLPSAILATAEAPLGGGGGLFQGVDAKFTGVGEAVVITEPPGSSGDSDWDWIEGSTGFYFIADNTSASDQLGWTWADGAITDVQQYDIDPGTGRFMSGALGVQNVITAFAAGPSVNGAWGNAGSKFFAGVNGFAFTGGPGPNCLIPPPPGTGIPIFNNHIRLSE